AGSAQDDGLVAARGHDVALAPAAVPELHTDIVARDDPAVLAQVHREVELEEFARDCARGRGEGQGERQGGNPGKEANPHGALRGLGRWGNAAEVVAGSGPLPFRGRCSEDCRWSSRAA